MLLLAAASPAALATTVMVMSIGSDRVDLLVNGTAVRSLRPGEASPEGVRLTIARDTSRFIRSSIHDVTVDLAWGALLAAVIVLVFLRDARSTLITAIAIPSSLLASFTFFYAFGFTLNTLTLMALSLSIGILIDDAIVVLENIYRHRELGAEPKEAASRGTPRCNRPTPPRPRRERTR